MAPGRRRGASKGKNAMDLTLGDLVLAKVKGFPAWPAKVSRPEEFGRPSDSKKHFVQFFGTQEIAFVAPADIQLFTNELRDNLLIRSKGKTVKHFAQAVNEISEAFEELERRKAGDSRYLLAHCTHVQESTNVIEMKPDASLEFGDVENKCVEQKVTELSSRCKEEPIDVKNMEETTLCNERTLSTKGTSSSPSCTGGSTVGGKQKAPRGSHDWKGLKNDSKRRVKNDVTHSDIPHTTLKNATTNSQKDLVCTSREVSVAAFSKEEKNSHLCLKRHNIADTERVDPAKRSKHATPESNSSRSSSNNDEKIQLSNLSSPVDTAERNSVGVKDEGLWGSHPKKGAGSSSIPVHETDSPLGKRHCGASEEKKGSFSVIRKSDFVKKRRAVRLHDDSDDDKPKTPVHGVSSARNLMASSLVGDSKSNGGVLLKSGAHDSKGTGRREDASPHKGRREVASSLSGRREYASPLKGRREDASALKGRREVASGPKSNREDASGPKSNREDASPHNDTHYSNSHEEVSPIPLEGVDKSNKEEGPLISVELDSKQESSRSNAKIISPDPQGCVAADNCLEEQNGYKILLRGPASGGQTKSHIPSEKVSQPKKVKLVSPQERPKVNPRAVKEGGSAANSRVEDTEIGKCISSGDSKAADSATSIKSLIAAAQAKRKQAQMLTSHGSLHELAASEDFDRKNPSPVMNGPQSLSDFSTLKQIDAGGIPQVSTVSPSGRVHGSEEHEVRKPDAGYQSGSPSLSGGTDAAVARDAFEGMIETLSRTKESIGRATRLAVDCAKYGIANEVVDLLVRKLETEASFHRKVDLFFLVDSITQCSHNQKGIAGALYIPAIEVALPRLLSAAAPPGASARENRRQCLKVLRLWLERKILPELVLRRFMDDLGASRNEVCTSLSFRRPSQAERTVDDPIRGMEGMLVDEYGSNATFELPGFFLSRAFDDDDVEEENEGVPNALNELSGVSLIRPAETALQLATPSDRPPRHILEDVDGELEMEDMCEIQKGEVDSSTSGLSGIQEPEHGLLPEMNQTTFEDEPLTPEGSPPLPHEPPPLLPPLPSSPPPHEPLPPSSPPPLPPPPPPLQLHTSSHPPLAPQPHFPLQVLQQTHFPLSPSLQLTYPRPVPHEFSNRTSGIQNTHVTGKCQQQATSYVPVAVSDLRNPSSQLEYGNHEMLITPQSTQPGQHLQPNYTMQSHGPFHQPPPLPAQTPSSQFSFSNPAPQHLQPPYPSSYPSVSFLDNRASFGSEAQLKSLGEYKLSSQHSAWINAGRVPPSTTPFVADGYYPPPPERSAANNVGFQHSHSTLNSVPAGYSNHSNSSMFPSRPDISTLNCWRPA